MKLSTYYLSGLLIALLATVCSCDDELWRANHRGSQLTENGDFRLSTFLLDKEQWNIPDTVLYFDIVLHSHSDDSELRFEVDCEHLEDQYKITIKIPNDLKIPDSDYDLLGYLKNGKTLGKHLVVTFRDEMFHTLLATKDIYDLTGKGTQSDPFQIKDTESFEEFLYSLMEDSISHGVQYYFKQTADIVAPNSSNTGENNLYKGQAFAGHYNGAGHTITIAFNGSGKTEDDDYIGLFTELLNEATIDSLTIDATITSARNKVGGLAGSVKGSVAVKQVHVKGGPIEGKSEVGGLVGVVAGNLTVNNCNITCTKVQGNDYIGGVVGRATSSTLTFDYVNYNLTSGRTAILTTALTGIGGGLVAVADKCTLDLQHIKLKYTVDKSHKDTQVIVANQSVGGFIGEAVITGQSKIVDCTMHALARSSNNYVGGLIGKATLQAGLTIKKVSVGSYLVGKKYVGGFFGYVNSSNHLLFAGDSQTTESNHIGQITNAYVKVCGDECVGGLFGYLEGEFKPSGLHGININVTANSSKAGGIVGHLKSSTLNANYFKLGNTMKVEGPQSIGGLAGYAESCTFKGKVDSTDIRFTSSIPKMANLKSKSSFPGIVSYITDTTTGENMGGIVGYASETTIQNICFSGTVHGSKRTGGIVGFLSNHQKGSMSYCASCATAVNNLYGDETGGLVGKAETTKATYKYLINYAKVTGNNYTGGVIGHITPLGKSNPFTLNYAVNAGEVKGTKNVGGVIAYLDYDGGNARGDDMKVTRCANYGLITNTASGNVGGIMGHGDRGRMIVMYCANHGDITSGSGASKVGGIVGRIGHDSGTFYLGENMEMAYCCNRGTISASSPESHVGGLAGYQEEGHQFDATHWMTHDCYNAGKVTAKTNSDTGGVLGCIDHYGEIVRCVNIGKVDHGNGVLGTHPGGRIFYHHNLYHLKGTGKGWKSDAFESNNSKRKTFKNFDFDKVWDIDMYLHIGDGYPYLRDCPFQFITYKEE